MLRSRRGLLGIVTAAGLGTACLAATGCSSPQDPLASISAQNVLATARSNADSAPNLTLDGTTSGSGVTDRVQLAADDSNSACTGTLNYLTEGTISFVESGSVVYLKPDATWWTANTGANAAGLDEFEAGRYFKQTLPSGKILTPWCDPGDTIADDTSDWGSVTKGQVTTVNGVRVLPLDGAHGDVIDVTDTNAPEITAIDERATTPNGNSVQLTVRLGDPFALHTPSTAKTLNAADFGFTAGLSGSGTLADVPGTLLANAYASMHAATTLTMTGSGAFTSDGKRYTYTYELGFKSKQGCTGTLSYNGVGSYQLTVIGSTVYWRPDDEYWDTVDPANAAGVIGLLDGRYIKGSASDNHLQKLAELCNAPQEDKVTSEPPPSGVVTAATITRLGKATASALDTAGTVTTVNGVQVLPITDVAGNTIYVSDTGKLELVRFTSTKSATSPTETDNFNAGAPVTLTAPPASQVIDGSRLGL